MKNILRKLHAQRLFWKLNYVNALCWAFYCVIHNKKIDLIIHQIMCFILYYNNPILNLNPKIQARGLIIYNTINDIIALRKRVNVDHSKFFLN
jgi:hypothetical protein